jgi:hypothetical protein
MEAYYVKTPKYSGLTASVGLRGGEAPEEDSDMASSGGSTPIEAEEVSGSESGELTLRGGAPRRARSSNAPKQAHAKVVSSDQAPALHTPLGGFSASTKERWLPLYGYQGVVWFRVDLHYTFVDAVDRLLCLDNRAGVSYSLYLLDKRKRYTTQAERDHFLSDLEGNGITIWATGPGDYSNDRVAWEWLVKRLGDLDDDNEVEQKALFVAGPGDPIPWKWEPDASHQVQKVALHWTDTPRMNRPDIAYLRMPENPGDVVYTNQSGPWMANVCRVLSAGRIPGRPGYPAIPDAWFTVPGQGRGSSAVGTYGGLAFLPQLWDTIVAKWEDDPAGQIRLEARTGPESETTISNRWHLFLPGVSRPYEKQYILHDEVDSVKSVRQAIVGLVKSSMSDASFSKIKSLEVHLPGAGFFLVLEGAPELVVSMTDKDLDAAFRPVVNRLVEWEEFLESKPGVGSVTSGLGLFPQFLSLRPVFDKYTICDADQTAQPIIWDPDATTLAQLRRLAGRVFAAGPKQPYTPDKSWIAITQGGPAERTKSGVSDPAESKPRFLVGPETTEEEWQSMTKMIVEPKVFIWLQDKKSLPRKSKQSWWCVCAC